MLVFISFGCDHVPSIWYFSQWSRYLCAYHVADREARPGTLHVSVHLHHVHVQWDSGTGQSLGRGAGDDWKWDYCAQGQWKVRFRSIMTSWHGKALRVTVGIRWIPTTKTSTLQYLTLSVMSACRTCWTRRLADELRGHTAHVVSPRSCIYISKAQMYTKHRWFS